MRNTNGMREGGVSLPPREAWIEINILDHRGPLAVSLPPREAWIEIDWAALAEKIAYVASPAGSVD